MPGKFSVERKESGGKGSEPSLIYSIFNSIFVESILGKINFIRINLVRIYFKIKWFILSSSFKSDSDRKYKIFTSPKINYGGKNWF